MPTSNEVGTEETTLPEEQEQEQESPGAMNSTAATPPEETTYQLDDLQCSICLEPYIDAVEASCSHRFCTFCIHHWFRTRGQTVCPVCRSEIEGLIPKPELDTIITDLAETNMGETQRRERAVHRRLHRADELCSSYGFIRPIRSRSFPGPDLLLPDATTIGLNAGLGRRYLTRSRSGAARRRAEILERNFPRNPEVPFHPDSAFEMAMLEASHPAPSSTSLPDDEESRKSQVEQLEQITQDFEFHLEGARDARERRLNAQKDIEEHTGHLRNLYERFEQFGVLSTREVGPNPLGDRNGEPLTTNELAELQRLDAATGRELDDLNFDPLAMMYQELDGVIGEAMFTTGSRSGQGGHGFPAQDPLSLTDEELAQFPTAPAWLHNDRNVTRIPNINNAPFAFYPRTQDLEESETWPDEHQDFQSHVQNQYSNMSSSFDVPDHAYNDESSWPHSPHMGPDHAGFHSTPSGRSRFSGVSTRAQAQVVIERTQAERLMAEQVRNRVQRRLENIVEQQRDMEQRLQEYSTTNPNSEEARIMRGLNLNQTPAATRAPAPRRQMQQQQVFDPSRRQRFTPFTRFPTLPRYAPPAQDNTSAPCPHLPLFRSRHHGQSNVNSTGSNHLSTTNGNGNSSPNASRAALQPIHGQLNLTVRNNNSLSSEQIPPSGYYHGTNDSLHQDPNYHFGMSMNMDGNSDGHNPFDHHHQHCYRHHHLFHHNPDSLELILEQETLIELDPHHHHIHRHHHHDHHHGIGQDGGTEIYYYETAEGHDNGSENDGYSGDGNCDDGTEQAQSQVGVFGDDIFTVHAGSAVENDGAAAGNI